MKTRIFNLVILDESGSMQSIKREAISGVNESIQTIRSAQNKYEDQEHLFTLVSFNSDAVKVIFDSVNIGQVLELKSEQYNPNCGTPLYDAMGIALNELRMQVEKEDKVLVTIITDGEENSSEEYSGKAIKSLVDELKSLGWVFTYIGANQDVESVADSISINNVMCFHATSAGTHAMFDRESKSRLRWFDKISEGCRNIAEDFFEND